MAFSEFIDSRVNLTSDIVRKADLGQAGLVEDANGGTVFDRAGEVVDVYVVAEDRLRGLVSRLDRGTREAQVRGVRKGVAEVPRVAIEEVVLAAVSLVSDNDDVAAVGEERVNVTPLIRGELLDGGEDDAA